MTHELPFGGEVQSQIESAVAALGLELCHVEWKPTRSRAVLTLIIDRREGEGGVTLDDCERASRTTESVLDAMEVPGPYTLEVSSPGLDRQLWTLADCRRFAGRRVDLRLHEKLEGTTRIRGVLESVEEDRLTILDDDRRRHYTVRFGDVRVARLVPDLRNPKQVEPNRTERSTR